MMITVLQGPIWADLAGGCQMIIKNEKSSAPKAELDGSKVVVGCYFCQFIAFLWLATKGGRLNR